MRSIHCRIGRRSTGKPPTSLLPSIDFFVGQHGAEFGAPVHRRFGDVGEADAVGIVALDRWRSARPAASPGLNQLL